MLPLKPELHTRDLAGFWESIEGRAINIHVFLIRPMLKQVAAINARCEFHIPGWHEVGFYPQGEEAFIAGQLTATCFDFCFNIFSGPPGRRFYIEDELGHTSGSMAMQRMLFKTFGEKPITAGELRPYVSSPDAINELFDGANNIPVPVLRHETGMDFVRGLEEHFGGDPLELYRSCISVDDNGYRWLNAFGENGLVTKLVRLFPVAYGSDVQEFAGARIAFNKRAQLAVLGLHGRAVNTLNAKTLAPLKDIDKLGPIADYSVPRALRSLGILRYSKLLTERVDNWKPILKDSGMELEIRVSQCAAVIELMRHINLVRDSIGLPHVDISQIDQWLWVLGRTAKQHPHLTKTSSY